MPVQTPRAVAPDELRALMAEPQAAPLFRTPLGAFLERRGRREEAVALYDEALAAGSDDAAVAVASGVMPLQEGAFAPAQPVTGAEAAGAIDRLEELAR